MLRVFKLKIVIIKSRKLCKNVDMELFDRIFKIRKTYIRTCLAVIKMSLRKTISYIHT